MGEVEYKADNYTGVVQSNAPGLLYFNRHACSESPLCGFYRFLDGSPCRASPIVVGVIFWVFH